MKTAAGQLPGFQWACNSFTTHIVPEKHHECSCVENRERCFSWPEGYCEKELLLLCGQRHVRAADKVLLTKGFTKEAIPIIQVSRSSADVVDLVNQGG